MTENATATAANRPSRRFAGGLPWETVDEPGGFARSAPIVLPERARPRPAPSPADLEALGRRTASVAHDFNNLLSVIMVCAGEIAAGAEGDQRERAEEIRAAAERGAELSRSLLAGDRAARAAGAAREAEPVAIADAIRSSARLIERALGPAIELDIEADVALPRVAIAAADLERVLLNLAANARDAMAGGGAAAIRAGVVAVAPGDPRLGTGWHVHVAFADTGNGMSADVAQRALEPYFSTKAGAGSGLGLAGAQAIVRATGGDLRINSRPGYGTTISIYLPALDGAGASLTLPAGG